MAAALDRLTERLVPQRKAPLLWSWEAGSLRLEVNGRWLEPHYVQVPLPLPLRSPAALALYLFLHSVRTKPTNKNGMHFTRLCDLIGIEGGWNNRQRDLNRAIAVVNEHLQQRLPDPRAQELVEKRIKVADRFDVKIDGDFVCFVSIPRQQRWDKEAEEKTRADIREMVRTGDAKCEAQRLAKIEKEVEAYRASQHRHRDRIKKRQEEEDERRRWRDFTM